MDKIFEKFYKIDELYDSKSLYEDSIYLFAFICNIYKSMSWKSKLQSDGTMYEGYFIAGIDTPNGTYTYYCELGYWNIFEIKELKVAPELDGLPSNIGRIFTLPKLKE